MANYAEVINNNGRVTLDDTHPRLVKTRTLSITAGRTVYPSSDYSDISGYIDNKYILGSYCRQQFDLYSNEFMVSVRAKRQHANVAVLGGFISSKKYQVTLLGSVADTNTYQSDYSIDIYGTVPSSGGTNSGLEIFNASGTKIFDSDFYTLDVSGTYSVYSDCVDDTTGILEKFGDAQTSFSIGGYSTGNRAVVINSSINKVARHQDSMRYTYNLYDILYGVVFGSTIFLEKRVSNHIEFFHDGGGIPPHGYSHTASGIILNTTNIT